MQTIYPVIVIYKTSLGDAPSYRTLIAPNHIQEFLVYDNSPADYHQKETSFPDGITYVRDITNSGLPKAYNLGAELAEERGCQRVLLLDQDTEFDPAVWECYKASAGFPGITAPPIVTRQGAAFSPFDLTGLSQRAVRHPHSGEYSLFSAAVANSGCCIPVSLFRKSGGYAEKVKLDFADFQFMINVRRHFPRFLLLDAPAAVQDFSNNCTDPQQMRHRFSLYLESARNFSAGSFLLQLKHHYIVFRHTLSLSLRTKSLTFLSQYVSRFIF